MGILLLPRTSSPDQVVKPEDLPRPGAVGIDEFNGLLFTRRDDGSVRITPLEGGNEHGNMLWNMFADEGRFCDVKNFYISEKGFLTPRYLRPYNGAVFSEYGQFYFNSSTFGGTRTALDAEIEALVRRLSSSVLYRRYRNEFFVMKIVAGEGTAATSNLDGVSRHLLCTNTYGMLPVMATWGVNIRVLSGSVQIQKRANDQLFLDSEEIEETVIGPDNGWKQSVYVRSGSAYEYNDTLFRFYAEPGSEILISHPFLSPGKFVPQPGQIIPPVASFTSWHPEQVASENVEESADIIQTAVQHESAELDIVLDSRVAWSHLLGRKPKFPYMTLVCKNAELGHLPGDEIPMMLSPRYNVGYNGIGFNGTEIWASLDGMIQMVRKGGNTDRLDLITSDNAANWKIKFYYG